MLVFFVQIAGLSPGASSATCRPPACRRRDLRLIRAAPKSTCRTGGPLVASARPWSASETVLADLAAAAVVPVALAG